MVVKRPRTGRPVGIQVMDMEDFEESINLLVYAESGVGKTVFGCSFGADSLVIRIEKGTLSAKRLGSKAKVVQVETWDDIEKVQKWLRDGAYRDYKWIIWDSLQVLQEKLWRHIMDKVVEANRSRDPDIPAQPDHLKMQLMIRRFMTLFCDLPVNCLFLAQPMNIETADGEEQVLPMIDGKKGGLSRYTVGLMTSFGRMHVVEDKRGNIIRRITWEPEGPYTGKDRTNVLAPHTDNKTLAEIADMIETGGIKPVRRPAARTRRTATRRRTTRG